MKTSNVVVVGGGWAGCAAAVSAAKAGATVTLMERTDMLLGTGLVGGIMRNNGRFTATEEMIAMGAGDLFHICDEHTRHKNIEFPGHKHASLYDIASMHNSVNTHLKKLGITILFRKRIASVVRNNNKLVSISDGKQSYEADVFIDATGTAGPNSNCVKHGNGCAMCVLRCPSFGGRKSLAGLCDVKEVTAKKKDHTYGAMSGSCKLLKESLSAPIQKELNEKGVCVVPLPKEMIEDKTALKACQQYASKEFAENIILLDTGHAKMMTPYYDLDLLEQIAGFEGAKYEDPYAGGIGNSIRYFDMCPHNEFLQVDGMSNLLCAGEKAGPLVGHTEAIVTGSLAGLNAARMVFAQPLFAYPKTLAVGDAMSYLMKQWETPDELSTKITFSGSVYFEIMKEKGLYITNIDEIKCRVKESGAENIFLKNLV